MNNALQWISAVAAVIAAIGGLGIWATLRTRWKLRVEQTRTDRARQENQLHRQRFQEVWTWAHNQPDGPDRARTWRWYAWWIGDPPGVTPGTHSSDADEAYNGYVGWLAAACYQEPRAQREWPRLPAGEPPLAWLDEEVHHQPMSVDVVFIVEPASSDGRDRRWAHVYLSMEKAKADVAYWATKDGHTTLDWKDETYCQTASSETGELLYTIVHTAVRHDNDPVP